MPWNPVKLPSNAEYPGWNHYAGEDAHFGWKQYRPSGNWHVFSRSGLVGKTKTCQAAENYALAAAQKYREELARDSLEKEAK